MSYAVTADLVARFGEKDIILLSDDANTGAINDDVVDQVLSDVDATIDGYLASRYALPLASVPAALVPIACDLARYNLATRNGSTRADQAIIDRKDDALKWLTSVATGKFGLGLSSDGTELPSTGTTRSLPPDRQFTRESLDDYQRVNFRRRFWPFGCQ